ncbi:MAG: hypothetical protein IJO59_01535 [Clostridia bacterium]|nr:hypothetical protein [Clostridia bacterium]
MHNGLWIWENNEVKADEYADFCQSFVWDGTGAVSLRISADSHYAVYLNGALAAFGQYADFPHCKVATTHDITAFCQPGENALFITVWYMGVRASTYKIGKPGLFFEVTAGGAMLAVSGTHTPCRKSAQYVSYREKRITNEIGLSCFCNAAGEQAPYHPAVLTGYAPTLHERPVLTLTLEDACLGTVIGGDGKRKFILDLGHEEVGFLTLALHSDTEQTLVISYGEHLVDGEVPRKIGLRDFSVEYGTVAGENEHLNPFRRLGCRYLCVEAKHPIRLHHAGIRPTMYPVTELPFDAGSARRQQIYEVSKRTLRLCMHEHYEDCPWREQSLYAMDSRNQMLMGYYAFGETRFPRANLWLFAQDNREDGVLSDCAPTSSGKPIPSFSLHWFQAIREYTDFSGDHSLVHEIWDKMCSVLDFFMRHFDHERCLVRCPSDELYWNFHEWAGCELQCFEFSAKTPGRFDLLLNCLLLSAIDTMTYLAELTGHSFPLTPLAAPLRAAIRTTFRREDGLYNTFEHSPHISELGCAYAVLTGVADAADAAVICRVLSNTETVLPVRKLAFTENDVDELPALFDCTSGEIPVVACSLSMTAFIYDALLKTDRETYKSFVLDDIDSRYGYMLDQGADTFWETMNGWRGFEEAGSMCHGWSTLAIYYYHTLL